MTVANFAEPRFAGLLNSMAPTAYFFGNVQQIPLWRRISHKSDCPHSIGLLQCPASTGTASAVSGQLQHASVAPRQSSVVPHFAWLVAICPRLASPPASMPFPAAWHDSYQEKPRVATARIAGMAVRGRTEKAAARLVYSAASEERERRGHCGYGS